MQTPEWNLDPPAGSQIGNGVLVAADAAAFPIIVQRRVVGCCKFLRVNKDMAQEIRGCTVFRDIKLMADRRVIRVRHMESLFHGLDAVDPSRDIASIRTVMQKRTEKCRHQ